MDTVEQENEPERASHLNYSNTKQTQSDVATEEVEPEEPAKKEEVFSLLESEFDKQIVPVTEQSYEDEDEFDVVNADSGEESSHTSENISDYSDTDHAENYNQKFVPIFENDEGGLVRQRLVSISKGNLQRLKESLTQKTKKSFKFYHA